MKKQSMWILIVVLAMSGWGAQISAASPAPQAQSGVRVILEAAPGTSYEAESLDAAATVIEQRLKALGLSDLKMRVVGSTGRIVIELPGATTEQTDMIQGVLMPGLLEFVDFSQVAVAEIPEGSCILTTGQVDQAKARLEPGAELPPLDQWPCPAETANEFALLQSDGTPYSTVMTGAGLADTAAGPTNSIESEWDVIFILKETDDTNGVDDFLNYVATHADKPMAIVLDGRLLSYPTIHSALSEAAAAGTMDGGEIWGRFTREEAEILAAQLNYGAMPLTLDVISLEIY